MSLHVCTTHLPCTEQTYYCPICLMYEQRKEGYSLEMCGDIFCKACLYGHFKSRINDGEVTLKCFAEKKVPAQIGEKKLLEQRCGTEITERDIITIISKDIPLKEK